MLMWIVTIMAIKWLINYKIIINSKTKNMPTNVSFKITRCKSPLVKSFFNYSMFV